MTSVLAAVVLFLLVLQLVVATTTLLWMLEAWREPQLRECNRFGRLARPQHSFSLLVPARHEAEVLGSTLDRLAAIDHPEFEVVAIVGHDDPDTHAVALAAAARHPERLRLVVDHNWPKSKPKALNTALRTCTSDIVGVFDAEDEVALRLLRHVDAAFTRTQADVVQGGVQLMNYGTNWWAVHNVLEYFFWFGSRLHFHARQHFVPLGGNTVFIRRALLVQSGGWDGDCLAEDCELGVRLSTAGANVFVAYDSDLVTREETPTNLRAFFKQRTRWHQGFLQVLRKGDWRSLPWRRRQLARYTLVMPMLQSLATASVVVSLATAAFVRLPIAVAMLVFLPLVPLSMTVAVMATGLHEFGKSYGMRPRVTDYLRLVLGVVFYQVVLGAAAVRATARELRGVNNWEKTAHVGAHRDLSVAGSSSG